MLIGLLMLLAPSVLYVITFPLTVRLRSGLRNSYRIIGGIVVFFGSGISFYLASYTGDQGGIGAYFFQTAVISVYLVLSVSIVGLNWLIVVSKSQEIVFQQNGAVTGSKISKETEGNENEA